MGIARSTLYNELKRGTVEQIDTNLKPYKKYFYDAGQRVYEQHRQNSRPSLKLVQAHEFIQYAEKQILEAKTQQHEKPPPWNEAETGELERKN